MITPAQAAKQLLDTGRKGMDDPTEAGLSYRWWIDVDRNLCGAWWRGAVTIYGPVETIAEGAG